MCRPACLARPSIAMSRKSNVFSHKRIETKTRCQKTSTATTTTTTKPSYTHLACVCAFVYLLKQRYGKQNGNRIAIRNRKHNTTASRVSEHVCDDRRRTRNTVCLCHSFPTQFVSSSVCSCSVENCLKKKKIEEEEEIPSKKFSHAVQCWIRIWIRYRTPHRQTTTHNTSSEAWTAELKRTVGVANGSVESKPLRTNPAGEFTFSHCAQLSILNSRGFSLRRHRLSHSIHVNHSSSSVETWPLNAKHRLRNGPKTNKIIKEKKID